MDTFIKMDYAGVSDIAQQLKSLVDEVEENATLIDSARISTDVWEGPAQKEFENKVTAVETDAKSFVESIKSLTEKLYGSMGIYIDAEGKVAYEGQQLADGMRDESACADMFSGAVN